MTVQVLVVDDEPDIGALFRRQFRGEMSKGLHTLDLIAAYGDANTVATALARDADQFLTQQADFPKLKQDHHGGDGRRDGGNG